MKALLALPRRPTAVFVANNLMTLGAFRALHEAGVRIPDELSLVGFDDMPWATSLNPPLTAVSQPSQEIGSSAADLLLDRIARPDRAIRHLILETTLVVRASCGALVAARPAPKPAWPATRAGNEASGDMTGLTTRSGRRPAAMRAAGIAGRAVVGRALRTPGWPSGRRPRSPAPRLTLAQLVTPASRVESQGRLVRFALHGLVFFDTLTDLFRHIDGEAGRWRFESAAARQAFADDLMRRGIESRVVSMETELPLELLLTHTRGELDAAVIAAAGRGRAPSSSRASTGG